MNPRSKPASGWHFPTLLAFLAPSLLAGAAFTSLAAASPAPSGSPDLGGGDPAKGQAAYNSNGCTGCHGANLEGGVGARLNPLAQIAGRQVSLTPDYLVSTITTGIPGSAMAAKGGSTKLTDQDIKNIAAFIIMQNTSGPAPLSPAELARSNVLWVSVGIIGFLVLTWMLARYNMRWIARRAEARRAAGR